MISFDESKIMSHISRGREEHHHCRTQRRTQCQKSRKCKIQESYCSSKSLCWRSHKCSYCLQRHSRICNVNHPSDIINVSIFLIIELYMDTNQMFVSFTVPILMTKYCSKQLFLHLINYIYKILLIQNVILSQ